jgi:single-strand DNA-binding protein
MKNINRVILTGNLTRDPELRSTNGGTSVLAFGIAVNDTRKNPSTGEWDEIANFFDCSLFGARADALGRILTKGMKVAIEGKLRYNSWEKDGQKHSKVDVLVTELEILNSRNSDGGENRSGAARKEVEIPPAPEITVYDEDIPF